MTSVNHHCARRLVTLAALVMGVGNVAHAQTGPARPGVTAPSALLGTWRVIRRQPAPWVDATAAATMREWIGQTVRVTATQVAGPSVLRCARPVLTATKVPAEGLFQGGLPTPAEAAARTVGLGTFPVRGVQLTCDAGVFEFHQADTQSMLLALDNVILTLDRSAGSVAIAGSPAGVVQRFLEQHFDGDMAFDSRSLDAKRTFLGDTLRVAIQRYLRRAQSVDEAPEINGDPFTDSQEHPTRFSVSAARMDGTRAIVPVRFSDAYRSYGVSYLLRRIAGRWLIVDVSDARGESLLTVLK